jgi:hypothetical protein
VEGTTGHAQAQLIIKLAGILDWPAMVVEGDSRWTDEIILTGIPIGLTAINTCASADAIRLITKKYTNLLADVIRPFDPCSVVDGARTEPRAAGGVPLPLFQGNARQHRSHVQRALSLDPQHPRKGR